MKRVLALICALCMVCCLFGCGKSESENTSKEKSLTIDDFESEFKESDSSFRFSVKESGSGYSFSYTDDDTTYSGRADSNKNVTSFSIDYDELNYTGVLNAKDDIIKAIETLNSGNTGAITMDAFWVLPCITDFMSICAIIDDSYNYIEYDELEDIAECFAYGKTMKVNGWSIKASVGSNTVTITATK